jgi:hypothetical protein
MRTGGWRLLAVGALAGVALLVVLVPAALAQSPWWRLVSFARPSYLPRGGRGQLVVTAANLGNGIADGGSTPVSITDVLPAGVKVIENAKGEAKNARGEPTVEAIAGNPLGADNRGTVACSLEGGRARVSCSFAGTLPPYDLLEVRLSVEVEEGAVSGVKNEVSISGGGAPAVSIEHPVTISEAATPFGVEEFSLAPEEEGGAPDTRAGSHPYQVTGTVTLNQGEAAGHGSAYKAVPVALPKALNSLLPPGLIGNPRPFAQCTLAQFLTLTENRNANECPLQTVVGVAMLSFNVPSGPSVGTLSAVTPIFNLEPAAGEPARFGFIAEKFVPVTLDTSVRSGGDYGVTLGSNNISQTAAPLSVSLTFWGVPGEASHDSSRGSVCLREAREIEREAPCVRPEETKPPPFLVMPTSCPRNPRTGQPEPLTASLEAASWQEPGNKLVIAAAPMQALDGCNQLQFEPSIKLTPDGQAASTPTGVTVDLHVPQESLLDGKGLAEAAVRDTTVTLPEGIAINTAGANGLEACSETLVGFEGFKTLETQPEASVATFTPSLPAPLTPGSNFCPNASKVGTVKLKLPILPNPLEGAVYLAEQNENPFGSLVAMYIVAEDPVSGLLIKLAGQVHLTPAGQLETTFENSPQGPFEDFEAHFFGGERAPLATPAHCGPYTTTASFTPWSGQTPVPSSSSFEITSGPNASACPGASLPFAPSLTAGSTNIQAAALTPFTTTISREDGNQDLEAISLTTPPGLSGLLTNVELCPEPQAGQGLCGPGSLIGETTVSVGLGGDPFTVTGGRVYITGPYQGAPFGLSIVNPAKAGPYDLEKGKNACDCVLVRAKIEVNPLTAALTVTSDSSGPYKIPTIIEGIPLRIKHVNITINRPGFTFNPTSCAKMQVFGSLSGSEGAPQTLSVPFQVTNCATLGFTPKFSVSTTGKTSKAAGADLITKLSYPTGSFASQANIARVKVSLPKQLPSRLTTLQKACTQAQFQANPAGCPPASIIGHATVRTPLLPVPVQGPAYFVSHGGEAFPSLTMVLQGYGVTIELVGTTFISKSGITSTTFRTAPDQPFNTFELTLPQGEYSALTADTNLCKTKLTMPTEFTAQNGAEIHRTTKITITGCPKVKAKKVTKRHKAKKGHKAKGSAKRGRSVS